jgi:hypothetical protein
VEEWKSVKLVCANTRQAGIGLWYIRQIRRRSPQHNKWSYLALVTPKPDEMGIGSNAMTMLLPSSSAPHQPNSYRPAYRCRLDRLTGLGRKLVCHSNRVLE